MCLYLNHNKILFFTLIPSIELSMFDILLPVARSAGCGKFVSVLKEKQLWSKVITFVKNGNTADGKEGDRLTLFCPTDEQFQKFLDTNVFSDVELRGILLDHLTRRLGENGVVYTSVANGGRKWTMQSSGEDDQVSADLK